ncbi:cytochrome P450 [Streptomyces mashuensis]|uniref:Cytochrome P450 n=1 Tax=Streptomyces mashuensis TaxID=33904 RepID=A0A919EFS2_9ACTN|nr:cytochrome P450 [Streptomyces mashuensis]GHF65512.1 cytochrome P450 [Streptomyces mashuensis]
MRESDLLDAAAFAGGVPYDYFRELRARPGLPRAVDAEGRVHWYLVRHADVVRAARDPETFRSAPSTMTSVRQDSTGLPLISFLDAPEHTRLRKRAFKGFTPARLAALEKPVAAVVDRILAEVTAADGFDLAEDVALRLPLEVLTELIGVPAGDREQVIEWTRHTVNLGDPGYHHSTPEKAVAAFGGLMAYFEDLVRQRRKAPGDDLFSVLLGVDREDGGGGGAGLEPEEIALFATTLMGAGGETTYCSLTGGVLALLENPAQLAALCADPSLVPSAVEEIVRWVTPATHFARQVARDTEIGGRRVRAGERVVLWYTSANRDEAVFDRPDRFDVARRPNPHVSFGGGGPHVCIGRGLAALELRLFLTAAAGLLPRLELTGPPVRTATNFMNSYRSVPARFVGQPRRQV